METEKAFVQQSPYNHYPDLLWLALIIGIINCCSLDSEAEVSPASSAAAAAAAAAVVIVIVKVFEMLSISLLVVTSFQDICSTGH